MLKKILAMLMAMTVTLAMAAVDVNNASEDDLDSIKGIGPSTTAKIMDARKAAKFKDWNDFIQRVPGIGDKRAAKLSASGLTVNGAAFKAMGSNPPPAAASPSASKTVKVDRK